MRRLLLSVALSLLAGTSLAQRPSTLNMTCGQAQGVVASQGAIVLSTGRHTFDRFVAHAGYCTHGEFIERAWVPTADAPRCLIGYTCRYRTEFFFDGF